MTIETITICNITSLAGEYTIDFTAEPLRSAGLFAITGDTGAGKSSLLDAICLALYNTTPRLEDKQERLSEEQKESIGMNSAKDSRAYLRRGAKEGFVIVRFSVPSGGTYEAGWKVGLTRNNTYKSVERYLDEISPKGKVTRVAEGATQTQDEVQRVTGLDYAQFSRTVLLAQGSFANFLKAQSAEKSELLEKLTGTKIYADISQKIYELKVAAENEVAKEESKLEGLLEGRLVEEEVEMLQHQSNLLESELANYEERKMRTLRFLDWHTKNAALHKKYAEAMANSVAANNEYLLLRDKEKALSRYDAVLPFRESYDAIKHLLFSISQNKEFAKNIKEKQTSLEQQKEEAGKKLLQAKDKTATAENTLQSRSGDITRGHKLQGEISTLDTQYGEANKKFEAAEKLQNSSQMDLQTRQQEAASLKTKLDALNLERQSLEVHRSMFDNYQTITEKLRQYDEEKQNFNKWEKNFQKEQSQQKHLQEQLNEVQAGIIDQEGKLSILQSNHLGHQQSIAHLSETKLNESYLCGLQRKSLLEEARTEWQKITVRYEKMSELRAAQQRRLRQIEQKETDKQNAEKEEQTLFNRFDQLKDAYLLSQVENVKNLRSLLQEGMPCPVCGSAHHPYHTEVEQVSGERQLQLKKDYEEADHKLKQQRALLQTIGDELNRYKSKQESDAQLLSSIENEQKTAEVNWQKFADLDNAFVECSPEVNSGARQTTIEMLFDAVSRQLKDTKKDLDAFHFHNDALKELNEKLGILQTACDKLKKKEQELKASLEICSNSSKTYKDLMKNSEANLESFYKSLDDLITMAGWRDEDKIDEFTKRLGGHYKHWLDINQSITNGEQQQAVLNANISNVLNNLKLQESETNECRSKCAQLKELLTQRRDEMQRLFGDDTPQGLTDKLQSKIDECTQLQEQCQSIVDNLDKTLQQTQGEYSSLQHNLSQMEENLRTRRTELDVAITQFNRENEPLQQQELERIFEDARDWQALRTEISACKDRKLLANQAMNDAEQAYNAWQAQADRPSAAEGEQPDALNELLPVLEQELEQRRRDKSEVEKKLHRHNECIKDAESQCKKLDLAKENATEWKRLDDLFGSKTGKKFRDIAQSYTFSLLVEHANFHLRRLTPRYELSIFSGSLMLEVVDHDMLDERRLVNSLSGGETFVVSLALALGLASLSNTTLNIGSLFIDEGFGHLDEKSLAMVLDALSALEDNLGRKVGVVSHTEQIREQVFPQIKIVKKGTGGSSTIEVE